MKLRDVISGYNSEKDPIFLARDQWNVLMGAEECEGNPGEERMGESDSMYEWT